MLIAFALGFELAFLGSIPIAGPIAALVLKMGLEGRYQAARALALGAALGEGAYAGLAFWGVASLLQRYPVINLVSQGVAAAILLGLGIYFVRTGPSLLSPLAAGQAPAPTRAKRSFLLGLTINVSNPTLIATFSAAIVFINGLGIGAFDQVQAPAFGLGAAAGTAAWFWTLLWLLHRHGGRLGEHHQRRLVRATGMLLVVLGLIFAARFTSHLH